MAIMGVPLYKIKRHLREHPEEEKAAKLLLDLRLKGERTLIAILIGNNMVNVALSIYAASLGDVLLAKFALV
ncbi:MAG: DUF21 domain-containing protein [Candidatus Peribacteria bacterium]|nr:MAG: DUF21 domain-containing protein [Candidatus Peribacteria bacterium]